MVAVATVVVDLLTAAVEEDMVVAAVVMHHEEAATVAATAREEGRDTARTKIWAERLWKARSLRSSLPWEGVAERQNCSWQGGYL